MQAKKYRPWLEDSVMDLDLFAEEKKPEPKPVLIPENVNCDECGIRFLVVPGCYLCPVCGEPGTMEVKAPDGEQSDKQIKFQAKVEELGHKYVVVRSVEDAMSAVE